MGLLKNFSREENMKTQPIMRAIILGGGIALLANPVWAGGGSHANDRNQAGQERTSPSGATVSGLDEQKTREIQQALQEKGFEPGSVDGMMSSQTKQAISEFQRESNLPVTGTVDEKTAERLGVEIGSSWSDGRTMEQKDHKSSPGYDNPSSSK